MKNRFLSVVLPVAIALVAMASPAAAKAYSPTQFTAELKEKVGSKKGSAATNAAAKFFQQALGDKKNSRYAEKYAKSVVSLLKKVVKSNQGKAADTLVASLLKGYFKPVKFKLTDSRYNKALLAVLKILPGSQKTTPVSQTIYNTIKNFSKNRDTQTAMFNYWNSKVVPRSGLDGAPPVVS